ncbi:MAG: hypothetical protein JRN39_02625 [Nitrososphaerota archaeon]|nr:hypothetical protein [Nitrososphaerota archaeon]MDG6939277.1 hypothetical protein [Nitrososphaerota archaeon]
MIRRFVERGPARAEGPVQPSASFSAGGRHLSILTDTDRGRTILCEAQPEERPWQRAPPGSPLELEHGGQVGGYGTFSFQYGPVAYGVQEAGAFKLATYGERVVKAVPIVNYKKRGIEGRVAGMKPEDALLLLERSAGHFSASYSTCFCTAVEDALGLDVPSRVLWDRAVAVELERIYNHVHVFAREAEAASQNVAASQANALGERVLRLNAKYFGHRYLFGFGGVGTSSADLGTQGRRRELLAGARAVAGEFAGLMDGLLSSRIFLDRLQGTARLSKEDATRLGAVGPAARGSGVEADDRHVYPAEPYHDIFVSLETEREGDSLARLTVRAREVQSSAMVLQELLDRMPPSGGVGSRGDGGEDFAICRTEGPSGDLIMALGLDGQGRLAFLHVRPSSAANWIPFAISLEGSVFTDFQFAYESFGLSFADSDG